MARVTSKDVAREASVSQATVSLVLRGGGEQSRISEQTQQLVRDAAARLGYVPSARARALKAGRSNVVIGVMPDLPVSEAMGVFQRALSQALEEAGYACVFLHPTRAKAPLSGMWERLDPAAIVAFDYLSSNDLRDLDRAEVPYVDGVLFPTPVPQGWLDQRRIGYLQVEHLAQQRHQRIGYAAVLDEREAAVCRLRLEGARDAARDLSLPELHVVSTAYTAPQAATALRELQAGDQPVTAVAAYGDVLALALLNACRLHGVRVPEDLAILGVDDIPVAALSTPALSTVAMDLSIPARHAAERVLELVGDVRPRASIEDRPVVRVIQRQTS